MTDVERIEKSECVCITRRPRRGTTVPGCRSDPGLYFKTFRIVGHQVRRRKSYQNSHFDRTQEVERLRSLNTSLLSPHNKWPGTFGITSYACSFYSLHDYLTLK